VGGTSGTRGTRQESSRVTPSAGAGKPPGFAHAMAGRVREVQRLGEIVDRCVRGTPTVVEITGDPGLGKTRLLAEVAAYARERGLATLSGRASEYEQERPFGVIAEALGAFPGLPAARSTMDPDARNLVDLVLSSRAAPDVRAARTDVERFHLFGAVARLLEGAGRALLCLDDLHWADDGTLELLRYLFRHPPGVPLILACAYRPRQAAPRLLACFPHVSDSFRTERLQLTPLPRRAAEAMLGSRVPTGQRERLYRASGGNPLYLEVLVRLAAGGADRSANGFVDLPSSLRAALVRELALLDPDQLTVLRAAAVLGDPFDPALLAVVADRSRPTTLAALDVLSAMDLVRARGGSGRRFEFRHPLLREMVSRDTPPGWWLAACGRVARGLRDVGAGPVERAPYIARSAQVGDAEAVAVLTEAAARTMSSVPATAASWLRAALRLVPPTGAAEPRLGILLSLAQALGVTGDLAGFRDNLRTALELLPAEQRNRRVEVVALQAMVERILGSLRDAQIVLETELAQWPDDTAAVNPLRLELATVRMTQRAYDESAGYLDAAVRHAPGDRGTVTAAAACRALGAAYNGKVDALLEHATQAAVSVDVMDDGELTAFLDPLGQLGWAEILAERFHDAARHMDRGIQLARRTGQSHVLPYLLLGLSWSHCMAGRLVEAAHSAEAAEEIAHLLDRADLLGFANALQARVQLLVAGPTVAAQVAERAMRSVRARGRLWGLTAGALAVVRLEQGRPEDCVELVQAVTEQPRHSGPAHNIKAAWYSAAAHAEAERGRLDAARRWADLACASAEAVGLSGQRGHAQAARAAVLVDDPAAAAALLACAARDFAASGQVLVEAQTRLVLGRALAATGELDAAADQIGQVKQTASLHGADHLHAAAVNAQRQLGAKGPRAPRPVLSPREFAIANLASRGLSNREIAQETFLSVKTVEAHLTRIFRKVGVRSRWALAQELAHPEQGA
jgi:DNA-binding NarL/FixJ family response regulator